MKNSNQLQIAVLQKELKTKRIEELYKSLQTNLALSIDSVTRAAYDWKELTNLGEDLTMYKKGIYKWLTSVADNKISARLLLKMAGNETVLRAVGTLSLTEQEKVLDEGVVIVRDNKTITCNIDRIKTTEISHIFGYGKVFSVQQQKIKIAEKEKLAKANSNPLITVRLTPKILDYIKVTSRMKKDSPELYLSREVIKLFEEKMA